MLWTAKLNTYGTYPESLAPVHLGERQQIHRLSQLRDHCEATEFEGGGFHPVVPAKAKQLLSVQRNITDNVLAPRGGFSGRNAPLCVCVCVCVCVCGMCVLGVCVGWGGGGGGGAQGVAI